MTQHLAQPQETSRRFTALYAPIAADLAETERILARELQSRHPFVNELVQHAGQLPGKRLRPALLLLTARACGRTSDAHRVLAAVVEMIHTATLVHDDVLDEATVRRHQATVHARWGIEAGVLLGDYLFTHAFSLASSLPSPLACRLIGRATNRVCAGELQQVHERGNLALSEAEYFDVIDGKTAELCSVSCRLGAHYSGASPELEQAMAGFGRDLGLAFQISDDLLDLLGREHEVGKSLGTDLEKQKLTLPLIRFLACASRETASRVERILSAPGNHKREALRAYLEGSDALAYAVAQAERFAASACGRLEQLPDSPAKSSLRELAERVVRRND